MKRLICLSAIPLAVLSSLGCFDKKPSEAPAKTVKIEWDIGYIYPALTGVSGLAKFYVKNSALDYTSSTQTFTYYLESTNQQTTVNMGGRVPRLEPATIDLSVVFNKNTRPKALTACEAEVWVSAYNKDNPEPVELTATGNGTMPSAYIEIHP